MQNSQENILPSDFSYENKYSLSVNNKIDKSEQYFRDLVDSSPAMLWVTRSDGFCTYLSKQWYEFTGRETHQDLGLGWTENIHPDDKEAAGIEFIRCSNERIRYEITFRLLRKDGVYRWVIDKGNPRFSPTGEFEGFMGTVIDIHDQIIAEKNLEKTRERFLRVAEATQLGIWYCDLPFSELIWNAEVKNHFWLPQDAYVDIDLFLALIHPDDRAKTKDAIDKSILERTPYLIDYRTVNPRNKNEIKWIRAIGWTDYDSHGSPKRFDGITLDVTQEILLREELQSALVVRDEFLSVASHELRTPLATVLLSSQMISRYGENKSLSPDKIVSLTNTMDHQIKRVVRLVEDMLDISRIRTGKLTLEKENIDMNLVIEESIRKMHDDFNKYKIEIPKLVTHDKVLGFWDSMRIEQVLINLLSNAIKYGNGKAVSVNIDPHDSFVRVTIRDRGMGIEEKAKEKIFNRFERAVSHNEVSGLGLGLYISKQIVESHGGKIWVESQLGQGSDFTIELPY